MAHGSLISASLKAIQIYLEEEFPGQVEAAVENVIHVSHHGARHYVTLQAEFLKACPNCAKAVRESDMVDYIREVRSQSRRFIVMWREREMRIRSAPA
jgi:hypothetical protein